MVRLRSGRWELAPRALLRLAAVYAAAGLCYLAVAEWGRRGDCGPQDVDGQCGMSTYVGKLYGLVGAGAVVIMYHLRHYPRRLR